MKILFVCEWCSHKAADLAGERSIFYSPDVRLIRVKCSGYVTPQLVLHSFKESASSVAITGCHIKECEHKIGNCKALARAHILKKLLSQLGIERFGIFWISAKEAERFTEIANEGIS
jgi:F420-non-reducing hydrogenase iron-sulfur subunit